MGTIISPCGSFRYRLERDVSEKGLVFAFFGINPSTADAEKNDQTITKMMNFTSKNGGRKLIVGNVFSYRSPYVTDLFKDGLLCGPEHDLHINKIIKDADILIPCWGRRDKVHMEIRYKFDIFMNHLLASKKPILTFGKVATGDPAHPLMLSYQTPLIPW